MKIKQIIATSLLCLSGFQTASAQEWQAKQGPMTTPWGETLDPDNVLGEYPRPQMEREEWMNLNGVWDLRKGAEDETYDPDFVYDRKILVPFPIESALSGVMEESDNQCYWYRRTLTIPESMNGKNILLHFDAVDWETIVYVNGKQVGSHTGGYDPFFFNITPFLKEEGEQELEVYIHDNTGAEGQPKGKQALNKWGCWYTPVSGIWQTVWLEPVNATHITKLSIEPDVDNSCFKLQVNATSAEGATADVLLTDAEGNVAASMQGVAVNTPLSLPLQSPHLWSPDDPYLYDLDIRLSREGTETDAVKSYCGMRKIEVKKVDGTPRIFLNGTQIFQMGPLDQGWWPDGLYTAPSDEALLFDVKGMKDLGFNMIRKHIKVEPSRWYMHCDREGILVWQDLPSPGLPTGYEAFARENFEDETLRIIDAFENHPSIVQWVVFNEGWGQFDTERMTQVVIDQVSPQSLVCCASGWNDAAIGDIKDSHSYPYPSCPLDADRAAVCGEYGGITLKVPGHIWPGGDFGYTEVERPEDFTAMFNRLADQIQDYYYYGMNAAVYTQLSDVEIEKNGIYTYDRRVLKPYSPTGELKAKIEECIRMPHNGVRPQTIVSTAKEHKYKWRFLTTDDAPRRWFAKEFNDLRWVKGTAAFGKSSLENTKGLISIPWTTPQIYLRRWFYLGDVTQEMIDCMRFMIYHDDDIYIYINGVWAATKKGSVSNYIPYDISDEARQTLKPNSWNLIAVKCVQGSGEQIVDVGISAFSEKDFQYQEVYDEYTNRDFADLPEPGNPTVPSFEQVEFPVPAEPAAMAVARGQFLHSTDRSNAAWGDFDNDGYLEVTYSGNNEHERITSRKKFTALYDNDGDGSFTSLSSPFDVVYYACPTWFDYNNDGLMDLFLPGVKSMDYDNDLSEVAAYLYENKGPGTDGKYVFEEVNAATPESNLMGISPIYGSLGGGRSRHYVSVGDYDKDGWLDLVIAGLDDYEDTEGLVGDNGKPVVHHDRRVLYLYKNNQGKGFIRQETPLDGEKPFTGLSRGSVHFADMDNDGWLDIVSSGYGPGEGNLRIYWNNGDGTFSENGQYFYGSYDSSCFPCDLDADGHMDILVTGFSATKGQNGKSFYIYRNLGNRTFEMLDDLFCGFEGVDGCTPSFGDVNHDGLPDILAGGHGDTHEITTWLYLNRGDFAFKSCGGYYDTGAPWTFHRISHGNNHLIDFDNDGFLDAWNMGWAHSDVCSNECATEIYRNTSADAGIAANEAPSAPKGLKATYDKATGMATFSWEAATDDVTPQAALQYNLYLKKAGTDGYFMTVPADLQTGFVKVGEISGQITTTTYSMHVDDADATYEWGVQAIDNGKKGGAFALSSFVPSASHIAATKLDGFEAHAEKGQIRYRAEAGTTLVITDAAGVELARFQADGEGTFGGLVHGIYMISATKGSRSATLKVAL